MHNDVMRVFRLATGGLLTLSLIPALILSLVLGSPAVADVADYPCDQGNACGGVRP